MEEDESARRTTCRLESEKYHFESGSDGSDLRLKQWIKAIQHGRAYVKRFLQAITPEKGWKRSTGNAMIQYMRDLVAIYPDKSSWIQ